MKSANLQLMILKYFALMSTTKNLKNLKYVFWAVQPTPRVVGGGPLY